MKIRISYTNGEGSRFDGEYTVYDNYVRIRHNYVSEGINKACDVVIPLTSIKDMWVFP